ncbi:concanavalin A-like lectin/glucanase domain-containing protein [Protomyces lactucae-debilis]|uniref:Concanavalin A-like lectin/glucanase domain-containing protein n=1 Tax=Protomyces lactucae-debilis TaxID=2754530 RepID=A0A1Y2FNJ1_PROLT|nr:concanavalin A-like lectin/glucanase domain-containing protein [Protomyces lactucae-debilis]ORY85561.1 concanavalin A-like lectin/glucanase domain-containing protein [Protomyces lactucae-debilis]
MEDITPTAVTVAGQLAAPFSSEGSFQYDEKFVQATVRRRSTRNRGEVPKPWLEEKKGKAERLAQALPFVGLGIGILITAYYVYAGYVAVPTHKYCLVLHDDFSTFNTDVWSADKQLNGYRNGDFQFYDDTNENVRVENGRLLIVPTLNLVDQTEGATLNITEQGCTSKFTEDCVAQSNSTLDSIINPIKSARISTKKSMSIKYGRVEVRARMPTGDWLWPAITLEPVNNVYGEFPKSGEIKIMESMGNKQLTGTKKMPASKVGSRRLTSAFHWGPASDNDRVDKSNGFALANKGAWSDEYHTFGVEWSEKYIYTYVDSRLAQVVYRPTTETFWDVGGFEGQNVINPWLGAGVNAPFDQSFYLSINVAVGSQGAGKQGGYFPVAANKPWQDTQNRTSSIKSFWEHRDSWQPTWPVDEEKRGMSVESVKMWQQCD